MLIADIENWPTCDFLISFFSAGFPLHKAVDYVKLRKPYCLNDLPMQEVLWDRRLVLSILDSIGVPTPQRLVTWHNDIPDLLPEVYERVKGFGIDLDNYAHNTITADMVDKDTIQVEGRQIKKPFVEKPVSGEDHNIYIYYSQEQGGGVRRLFRKVRNKSSEFLPDESNIRCDGTQSYIYEEFIQVDNAEDVKVYTIGPHYAHAETRKSPVVDGIVKRNVEGKEIRQLTELSPEEMIMAEKVCKAYGQTVCGFDLLRVNGKSYVIDVNGWSFVKGNLEYYDKCAITIREIFLNEIRRRGPSLMKKQLSVENQWKIKGFFSVMRHADRTPKQKLKFTFKSELFLDLVRGSDEEIVLKKPEQVKAIFEAVQEAIKQDIEDPQGLQQLSKILDDKGDLAGTKVQLRPYFSKTDNTLEKMQVIVKWGGLLTHGGDFHSRDLGNNLRTDLSIMHREMLNDVMVYCSSEMRVIATAKSFCQALVDLEELPNDFITISKEMLDDSNAAKEQMDVVKKRLQAILNPEDPARPPPEFIMPEGMADLAVPVHKLIILLRRMRDLLRKNMSTPFECDWCTPESPFLFKERWEKLFRDFCDVERTAFEPSKISELYDSLKFDLLHNRLFIENAFKNQQGEDLVRILYRQSKEIFDIIGPHEYGIENSEKLEIGFRNTSFLLKQLCQDLEAATESPSPCTRLYFTKESKVYCLLNVVLLCGLKTKIIPTDVPELDYLTQITFELYERNGFVPNRGRDYSLRIALSLGAHDPNLIDLQLTNDHSVTVEPRKWISDHISLDEALLCLKNQEF